MKSIKKIFTPGESLGQFVHRDQIAAASSRIIQQLKDTGSASKKADYYPWLTCVPTTLGTDAVAAAEGTRTRVVRPTAQDPAFYNPTTKRLFIDEMRIAALDLNFTGGETIAGVYAALTLGTVVRLPKSIYVDQWMPLAYLNNQTNIFNHSVQLKGAYTLPAPYFLEQKNTMKLRIRQRWQSTNPGDLTCWFSLFGIGADGFPIYLVKSVTIPEKAVFAPPYYYDVVFDDNRDRAIRDAWITHVGFAFGQLDQTDMENDAVAPHALLSALELQFRPLAGPIWMREDDWIPLWLLQDQPGMVHDFNSNLIDADFSQIIHRFESPVVLEPRDEIQVELQVNTTAQRIPGFNGNNVPIWCAFYGRQEA